MSQIYKSVSSTPSVPTSITSDGFTTVLDGTITPTQGTVIPQANNVQILGGFTDFDNINGIQTLANPNNSKLLEVQLTNRISISGNIPSGPTFAMVTFPLSTTGIASYRFNLDIVIRVTTATLPAVVGDTMGYTLFSTFKTTGTAVGAVATRIGTCFIDADEDTNMVGASIDMVSAGNNAILQFTPVANNAVTYNVVGYYVKI